MKTKLFLALLLCQCMVMTMLPTTAFAMDVAWVDNGSTPIMCNTWEEAVNAVQAGGTINLATNIDISSSNVMPSVACTIDGGVYCTLTTGSTVNINADTTLKNINFVYSDSSEATLNANFHNLTIQGTVNVKGYCISAPSNLIVAGNSTLYCNRCYPPNLTVNSGGNLTVTSILSCHDALVNGTVKIESQYGYFRLYNGDTLSGTGTIVFASVNQSGNLQFCYTEVAAGSSITLKAVDYTPQEGDLLVQNTNSATEVTNINLLKLGDGYSSYKLKGAVNGSYYNYVLVTPPAVVSVTPAGTDAPLSGNLTITFSEAMDTATTGTVSLGGTILTGGTWSNENKTYTVPYSDLAYSTAYTAAISGFADTTGNGMDSDSTHSFTTLADTVKPTVASVTPTGTDASLSGNLIITFSEAINTTGTVSLDGGSTSLTGGSWSEDKLTYTIPYSSLNYNTQYTASISGFADTAGNTIDSDSTHSFTTLADTVKPTVSGVTPTGTDASLSGNIVMTFDEAMNITEGTVSLDGGSTTLTGGSWSEDKLTYTIPYSGLSYSTAHTVALFGFEDTSGNTMEADSTHSFTTEAAPDVTKPTVSSVMPNGTGISIGGNIVMTFDEAMNITEGTVSLDGGNTTLTGGTWSNENKTYTIPYSGLSYSTAHTVALSGFEDTSGNTMENDSTHSFTTEAAPDVTKPTVSSVTPNGTGISIGGNIVMTFDEAIKTTTAGEVYLSDDGGTTYGSALTGGSWSVGNTNYTIGYSVLSYNTSYTIKIEGFKDAAGNTMATDSTHSFTTAVTYPVTYHANDGTGTAPTESNKAAGATFIAAANTFTAPTGKQFKEWNTAANGTGTGYLAGATVTMSVGNLTLYAIWEDISAVTHTVSVSASPAAGGNMTGGGTYSEGASVTVTAAVYSGYSFVNWTVGGSEVSTNASYTFTLGTSDRTLVANFTAVSTDKILESIETPDDITGVDNGTAKTAEDLGLPEKVTLATDDGNVQADVDWDVASSSYDPDDTAEQTFTVDGTVTLPSGVINPDSVSLDVSIDVTVNAAASTDKTLVSVTAPTAITGVANGTEKTASALGLPSMATLVTNDGNVQADVTWDVASSSYDPDDTDEQTFTVDGTVTLPSGVVNPDSVSLDVTIDVTVNAAASTDKILVSVTAPTAITGVANGTAKTASALGLPSTVTLATDDGNVQADVDWDVASSSYDPDDTAEQTFTVDGTVTLPSGVINPDSVSLDVSIDVTVNAAASTDKTLVSVTAPTAITGVANGTAKTASALGLPSMATLVTDDGNVQADVDWDVASSSYDPDDTAEQTFTVDGTVTLPSGVINPDSVSLDVSISVSVNAATSTDKTLVSIVSPSAITGVTNGTAKTASALGLPGTVTLVTSGSNVSASVSWDVASSSYNVSSNSAQTFTVNGTVTLPAGVINLDNVSLSTSISVTVNAGSNGGGGGSSHTSTASYKADVSDTGSSGSTLPVNVNISVGSAAVDLGTPGEGIFTGKETMVITVPSITGVNTYTLDISASSLSSSQAKGSLTFATGTGSIAVPDNMLSGISGTEGKKAGISIGQGDKSGLPDAVKTAIGDRPLVQLTLTLDGTQTAWNKPDAPVTATIPYTPTATELADPEHITVWYIDGAGNAVSVPSGRYDTATGMVTFSTTHFSNYAVVYVTKTFDDLESAAWAKMQIEVFAAKGILKGTSETAYSPQTSITRADFLYYLVRTLGVDAVTDGNFDDISSDAYYCKEIAIAKKRGITNGTGNSNFSPDSSITRQDMIVMTESALKLLNRIEMQGTASDLDKFADKSLVAAYAVNSVASAVKEGLIVGSGDKVNPLGNTTRAEAAVFLYRIYNKY